MINIQYHACTVLYIGLFTAKSFKVLFHAVNNGGNEGAIGLDNTHLLLPSGGSPDSASERACLQK